MRQGRRASLFTVIALIAGTCGSVTAVSLAGGTTAAAHSEWGEDEESDREDDGEDREDGALAVPNELIVRFDPGADEGERAEARRRARTTLVKPLPLPGLELLGVDDGASLAEARASLERERVVLYVELNYYRRAAGIPNDPYFSSLWGFDNTGQTFSGVAGTPDADIDAPEAWNVTVGDIAIGVAVLDSGVDLGHRDLAPNAWTNPGESGGGRETNRRDDDSNGLVDDFRGWDWVASDNSPADGNGHGTHVAGTIGARGNDGFGVPGVDWTARLVALRVLDDQGSGTSSSLIQAYDYAGRKGARVVNASLGGGGYSRSEYDLIRGFPNVLFVVAAGNDANNNDRQPEYPCAYDLVNVLCVAASNQHDGLASFSNYGVTTVDLAAPGTKILSTWPGGGHAVRSGTSMATPHVAGAAALLLSRSPAATATTVKSALLQSVNPKPGLAGIVATGGRLNLARAFGVEPAPPAAPGAPPGAAPVTRDSTPPGIYIRVSRRARLKRVLRRGVRAYVRCSEGCRVKVRLVLARRSSRRLKLLAHGQRVVGRRLMRVDGRSRVVVVRIRRSVRKRLARVRRARILVLVTARDGAGNVARAQRALTLRR
jgi:subtilisin family serine protease